jgi:hypothetical protein|nr:MAG TPA: hypothetical protein [Caudoviricetes sp.]
MQAYEALKSVLMSVERNHSKLRVEPNSDGVVHDKWEAEDEALGDLEEALEEAVEQYEMAMEIRKSLRTMTIST